MAHAKNCLIYLCTCNPDLHEASDGPCAGDLADCPCHDCHNEREAEKDREFDEKVALAYI